MTISREQLVQRRRYLGSSDAPAVVGVNPWRTPADVYYEKTLPELPGTDDEPGPQLYVGNLLEAAFLRHAERILGCSVDPSPDTVFHPEHDFIGANLDGVSEQGHIVECKYVGPRVASHWGRSETDEIPEYVLVQVQHQLACAETSVPALVVAGTVDQFDGLELRHYLVQPDARLQKAIIDAEARFWRKHVLAMSPPEGVPRLAILRRLARIAETAQLGDEALEAYEECSTLKRAIAELQEQLEDAKARLVSMLGGVTHGRLPTGAVISYREENAGMRVDCEKLKREYPEVYESVARPCSRWVLRGI